MEFDEEHTRMVLKQVCQTAKKYALLSSRLHTVSENTRNEIATFVDNTLNQVCRYSIYCANGNYCYIGNVLYFYLESIRNKSNEFEILHKSSPPPRTCFFYKYYGDKEHLHDLLEFLQLRWEAIYDLTAR
jgi:hypothetical protein